MKSISIRRNLSEEIQVLPYVIKMETNVNKVRAFEVILIIDPWFRINGNGVEGIYGIKTKFQVTTDPIISVYPINIVLGARTGPEPSQHWPVATGSDPALAQFWCLRQCLWGRRKNIIKIVKII